MALNILYLVVLTLFAFATLASVPGPLLISLGTTAFAYQTGFTFIPMKTAIIFLFLGILGLILDNIFTLIGAKKFGASKYGIIGAFIGFFTVFIIGPPGILMGPPLGAFLAEILIVKKPTDEAVRAAFGAVLGMISGIVAKFLLALGMVIWFATLVF